MARPYGQIPKYTKKSGGTAQRTQKNLRVKLHGRNELEQISFLLQQLIAKLQDQDVHSIENCSLYLTPLNAKGERMLLKDQNGKPLETIEITLPVSARFIKAANS